MFELLQQHQETLEKEGEDGGGGDDDNTRIKISKWNYTPKLYGLVDSNCDERTISTTIIHTKKFTYYYQWMKWREKNGGSGGVDGDDETAAVKIYRWGKRWWLKFGFFTSSITILLSTMLFLLAFHFRFLQKLACQTNHQLILTQAQSHSKSQIARKFR